MCVHSRKRLLDSGGLRNYNDQFTDMFTTTLGRDSVSGVAIHFGMDSLGFESRWEVRYSAPNQIGLGAHLTNCTMGIGSFHG